VICGAYCKTRDIVEACIRTKELCPSIMFRAHGVFKFCMTCESYPWNCLVSRVIQRILVELRVTRVNCEITCGREMYNRNVGVSKITDQRL